MRRLTTEGMSLRRRRALLCLLSALLVLPSTRLWLSDKLTLTPFEFDYWLGLFDGCAPTISALAVPLGRLIHFLGFLAVGAVFCSLVRWSVEHGEAADSRKIVLLSTILAVIWTAGMPWVSPDVFFYIGTGWLDGHYGLSPYLHGMDEAAGFPGEPMFGNVFPGFLAGKTSYGPLFQALARTIALLSGGRELLALGLFKALALALHLATCVLVWRLAPAERRATALLLFACNPLVLFSLLTCAHNDELMIFFVLLALVLRNADHPGLAGAALGAAVSAKYVPVMLLPLFLLDVAVAPESPWSRRLGRALRFGAGFALTIVVAHGLYPEAVRTFLGVAARGIPIYRNSIYFLLPSPIGPGAWRLLVVAFAVAAGAGTGVLLLQARKTGRFRLIEACLLVWMVFFLFPNNTNQEWYLTWLIPLAAVLPSAAATAFVLRLSLLFMPLVIYTVKGPPTLAFWANVVLYLVFAGCALLLAPGLLFPPAARPIKAR